MLSQRRAVPYSLLAVAVLATVALPLGLRAIAAPGATDSEPRSAGAGVNTPAGPVLDAARASRDASDAVRLTGPTVLWTGATGTWIALSPASADQPLAGVAYGSLAAAGNAASTWSFPAPGAVGPVRQGDLCITIPAGPAGTPVTTTPCAGTAAQRLSLIDSPNGPALRSEAGDLFADFRPQSGTFQTHLQERGDGVQLDYLTPVGLRDLAVTEVVPGEVGTATVSGSGTPDARVSSGSESMTIDEASNWQLTLTGVDPGGATIRFEQSINGAVQSRADAVVPAWPTSPTPPAAPTASVTFPEDVTQNAILHGDGADGATITIRYNGEAIATTTVDGGHWSTDIAALGSGPHELAVTQTVGELESPATPLTIDYGAPVTITSPGGDASPGRDASPGGAPSPSASAR